VHGPAHKGRRDLNKREDDEDPYRVLFHKPWIQIAVPLIRGSVHLVVLIAALSGLRRRYRTQTRSEFWLCPPTTLLIADCLIALICISGEFLGSGLFRPTHLVTWLRTYPPLRFSYWRVFSAIVALLWWRDLVSVIQGRLASRRASRFVRRHWLWWSQIGEIGSVL